MSIVIPAYNESKTIVKTLESAYNLNYPRAKMEIIVVNDGSSDGTLEIITQYIKDKPNFRVLSHQNIGKAASLNKALDVLRGEFFACLDADSFVERHTLRRMLSLYYQNNDPHLAIVTPAMKVSAPSNILQKVQWLEYIVITLISRISSHLDALYVAPGPFSLYRTSIIRAIGGFDEKNITEDQEIAYRVQKHHYRITQCCDGYVFTTAPATLGPFYRQRRRWYLGSIVCIHKYRSLIANTKYGDFGTMQMTKNVFGYVAATLVIVLSLRLMVLPMLQYLKDLLIVGFDIMPFLRNFKFHLTVLNFLLNDFRAGILILALSLIGLYLFYRAHQEVNEKAMKFGFLPLVPYFAFYYTLKGAILLLCLFEFVRGKKMKW